MDMCAMELLHVSGMYELSKNSYIGKISLETQWCHLSSLKWTSKLKKSSQCWSCNGGDIPCSKIWKMIANILVIYFQFYSNFISFDWSFIGHLLPIIDQSGNHRSTNYLSILLPIQLQWNWNMLAIKQQ